MTIEIEAYTGAGLLRGQLAGRDPLADVLEALDALALESVALDPIDGGLPETQTRAVIETDDLLVVVCPPDIAAPIHAAWHPLAVTCGPYRVTGELPTLPGYDPGRSLARPGGPFVMLGRVQVRLHAAPGAGQAEHAFAWINRYGVEAYEADLDLGAFFPGAIPAGLAPPAAV